MANTDRPSGLSPVGYLNGSPWNGQARLYYIPSTDTNAFAIGDPVASSGSADANGVASVTLATAGSGNAIRGVIVSAGGLTRGGAMVDPDALGTTVIPATKTQDYYVMVVDDPMVIFEAQEEDTGTAFTVATVGLNANLAAGTNNGYVSGWEIDTASPGTGSTLQVRLLGLAQREGSAFGDWAKWLVVINNHEFKAGVAGVS